MDGAESSMSDTNRTVRASLVFAPALLKALGKMAPDERKARGVALNRLRDDLTRAIEDRGRELEAAALEALSDTSATKVTLPFVEEQLKAARDTMGEDYWSYGVAPNRPTIETFLGHHFSQGLSSRQLSVDEIFHPATYESYVI